MDYPLALVMALFTGNGTVRVGEDTVKALEDVMHGHLSGLQQQIILGIYRDNRTFVELGKELHMKPAAVEGICGTGLVILEKHIDEWCNIEADVFDELPTKVRNTLYRNNITCLEQLAELSYEDIVKIPKCGTATANLLIEFIRAHSNTGSVEDWVNKLQSAIATLLPKDSIYQNFDEPTLYALVGYAFDTEDITDCLQLAISSREYLLWFLDALLGELVPWSLSSWYPTPLLKELVPADKLTKLSFWAECRVEELMTSLFTEGLKEHILRHYNDGVSFETLDKEMIVEQPMSAEQCVEHGLEILKHYGYSYLLDGAPPMQPSAEYIFRLGVGDKVYNTIYENIGDVTVQQMSEFSAKELLAVDGLGKVAVQRIARILEDLGYGS